MSHSQLLHSADSRCQIRSSKSEVRNKSGTRSPNGPGGLDVAPTRPTECRAVVILSGLELRPSIPRAVSRFSVARGFQRAQQLPVESGSTLHALLG
jgi:hypothetical protein